MEKNDFFSHLSVNEQEFNKLIASNNYACNAAGRAFMAEHVKVTSPRPIPKNFKHFGWGDVGAEITPDVMFTYAELLGGCEHMERFDFNTPHGKQHATVTCIDSAFGQNDKVPTYVCWFSGCMNPWVAIEVIRFYAKQYGELPEFLALGKGGNKGLFEKVYNRKRGLVKGSEAEAYCNIMSLMAPESYARKYQQVFNDMDTAGNLRELYRFLKEQYLTEANIIVVTGQPWYDKRVLAEWMLMLRDEEFAEVKINLTLAHSPVWMDGNSPDTKLSEISLGYMAASLGPLSKDTVPMGSDEIGERYLLPDVETANWPVFEEIIRHYGNMGWPNYSELLYGTSHEEAVKEIILAHLFAEASFTAEDYDRGVFNDIIAYQSFVGEFVGETEEEFLQWCINTPDERFA